jgi:hypothetical protein
MNEYLQNFFFCPVPTLRQIKRTIPDAIVRAPSVKVSVTLLDDLSTPFTRRTTGTLYITR